MIFESLFPATKACNALEVSKSAYYKWKNKEPVANTDKDILPVINDIAREFPKYGYRRITKELHRRGFIVNHKKVYKIQKENNLLVRRKRRFRPVTTQSDHSLAVYPNLIKNLEIVRMNQVWAADITYIWLTGGFVYLAAILDLFSRKCIGWELSRNVDANLTLAALNMAIKNRKHFGFSELIHHSDRGVQYASQDYVKMLKLHNIRISMSRKGNVYDNAYLESFMKTLKIEEVYIKEYENFEDAYNNIMQFIEIVYNEKRLHSGIDYKPPVEFENEVLNTATLS